MSDPSYIGRDASYSSSSCYVTFCTPIESMLLRQKFVASGYAIDHPPFMRYRACKKGISCAVYLSGKVLVQGKSQVLAPFIAEFFPSPPPPPSPPPSSPPPQTTQANKGAVVRGTPSKKHIPCMGFDESGKGDVFGPLCLGGVYVGEDDAAQLEEWGVCDSKRLTDKQILNLAPKIRRHYPHESMVLMPEEYNRLYASKFHNLNRLLAWGHVQLMQALYQKTYCAYAMLDQFSTSNEVEKLLARTQKEIVLTQRTRAESIEIAVAAASILARAAFIEGMETLSKEFGFTIPKGATHGIVPAGKRILRQHGEEGLFKTMKLHFKTLVAIRE